MAEDTTTETAQAVAPQKEQKHTYYAHSKFADQFQSSSSRNQMGRLVPTHRRHTLAAVLDNNTLRIGIAICSESDQFARKTGRQQARRNAFQNPIATIDLEGAYLDHPVQALYHFIATDLPGLKLPIAIPVKK